MNLHFAGVPEHSPAHVMLMASVGKALRRRGHRFTLFQAQKALSWANAEEVDLCALDVNASGSIGNGVAENLRFLCGTLPRAVTNAGIHCIIADSMMPAGAAVAEALGIPFTTLSAGSPINSEPDVPPSFVPWGLNYSAAGRLRNRVAYGARNLFLRPALTVLNEFRAKYRLAPYRSPEDSLSRLAQVSPLVKEFDFPRYRLPACFHYVGPFERTDPDSVRFPYERLSNEPFAYFCCGTISACQRDALHAAVIATRELGVQLVVAGRMNGIAQSEKFPSHVIQVSYAPQRTLLHKAGVFITHGGLNSALESLMAGVPLLAIPKLRFDHPGVAARIAYHKVGKVLTSSQRRRPAIVRHSLAELLEKPDYRERAQVFQTIIRKTGGADAAADIIEKAARTALPVETLSYEPVSAGLAV